VRPGCTPSSVFGPPQHAWGRRPHGDVDDGPDRSTPTRVGPTSCGSSRSPSASVHPHTRGDDTEPSGLITQYPGPPPHAWLRRPVQRGTGCHPAGPPPHAWGRHQAPNADHRGSRSTPTRVGTTRGIQCRHSQSTVHPHTRGDDLRAQRSAAAQLGPPPRVGTTVAPPWTRTTRTVHPHTRGDDSPCSSMMAWRVGPPPHAWGRRSTAASRFWASSVHPHTRGDDVDISARTIDAVGPPPHAWGRREPPTGARSR